MSHTLHTPSPEDHTLLSQTLRDVARARRLSPEDAQDFIQSAELKLLERNYDVFRRFDGRSSLRTYLTVVATRLLLDWRNSTYGKWRASAAAVSLGRVAVLLETLMVRDGHSQGEAVAILLGRSDAPSKAELLRIAGQLPPRERRRMVSDESLFEIGARFEDPVGIAERRRTERRVRLALAAALRQLPVEERQLIKGRYGQNCSVQALAAALNTDPKKLYRRFDRALRTLRHLLVAAGISGPGGLAAES